MGGTLLSDLEFGADRMRTEIEEMGVDSSKTIRQHFLGFPFYAS